MGRPNSQSATTGSERHTSGPPGGADHGAIARPVSWRVEQRVTITRLLVLVLLWPTLLSAEATLVGTLPFPGDRANLRGLSGIEMSDDGMTFVVISDRGRLWEGSVARDAKGRVTAIRTSNPRIIRAPDGSRLPQVQRDLEGVARLPDGGLALSFEGDHRVGTLRGLRSELLILPRPRDFASFGFNSGLEALAAGPDGALYALPERSGRLDRPFDLWRWDGQLWEVVFRLRRTEDFLPVGADFGPDGRLYVLERALSPPFFQSRVRAIDLARNQVETVLTTRRGQHGNLEGLSVWQAEGHLRLTMVSDDNFNDWFRGELVEYRLAP